MHYDLNVTYTFERSMSSGDPKVDVIRALNIPLYVSMHERSLKKLWQGFSPIREVSSFPRVYVQASMELGPENVSLLERCPHFREC